MHVHAFSMYISMEMLNRIQEQVPVMYVPTDSPASLSELMPLHSLTATQQRCSSDIIAASLPLYKKLSDITEHAPETDA